MAVRIGHASISEKGIANGEAGDSTGKEVCIRSYYTGYNVVLRPTNKAVAELSATACELGCENNNIGYGQNSRNTLHTEAKKVGYNLGGVKTKCNSDCSSFMTVCAIAGGVTELEYTSNAPTTRTMVKKFTSTGRYKALTDEKYLVSSAYLKRGDICVNEGKHTFMILDNGALTEGEYYPIPKIKTTSIVDALTSIGVTSTKIYRKKIAMRNGISNYTGTASQNSHLRNLLYKGLLKRV